MTTTFHCDKLCAGNCSCLMLRAALAFDDGPWPVCAQCEHAWCSAKRAVDDPAKLAELMASALRTRGFDADVFPWTPQNGTPWTPRVHVRLSGHGAIRFELPQARAELLAIMQTEPDESSHETCERILRGDT